MHKGADTRKCVLHQPRDEQSNIAQAIMEHPKLLLLDEPFNGLDEESEKSIKELLLRMNEKENTTILTISHDSHDVLWA